MNYDIVKTLNTFVIILYRHNFTKNSFSFLIYYIYKGTRKISILQFIVIIPSIVSCIEL